LFQNGGYFATFLFQNGGYFTTFLFQNGGYAVFRGKTILQKWRFIRPELDVFMPSGRNKTHF